MIIAAIDIGSNAIRLLINDINMVEGEVSIEKISLTRVPIRLGEDVFLKGRISREKMLQLSNAMKAFWYLMDVHKVEYFRACATSAMREAKNRKEIIHTIAEKSNIKIDILSGDEEAELIFKNYDQTTISSNAHYTYIDVGGGSTEISFIFPMEAASENHSTSEQLEACIWDKTLRNGVVPRNGCLQISPKG